jgi:hypothetical protein
VAAAGAEFVDGAAVIDGRMVSARAWPDHPAWMREFIRILRSEAPPELPGPRPAPGRAGYPGRGGGSWLRMVFPSGLVTWLVPSACAVSTHPIWCSTT